MHLTISSFAILCMSYAQFTVGLLLLHMCSLPCSISPITTSPNYKCICKLNFTITLVVVSSCERKAFSHVFVICGPKVLSIKKKKKKKKKKFTSCTKNSVFEVC